MVTTCSIWSSRYTLNRNSKKQLEFPYSFTKGREMTEIMWLAWIGWVELNSLMWNIVAFIWWENLKIVPLEVWRWTGFAKIRRLLSMGYKNDLIQVRTSLAIDRSIAWKSARGSMNLGSPRILLEGISVRYINCLFIKRFFSTTNYFFH